VAFFTPLVSFTYLCCWELVFQDNLFSDFDIFLFLVLLLSIGLIQVIRPSLIEMIPLVWWSVCLVTLHTVRMFGFRSRSWSTRTTINLLSLLVVSWSRMRHQRLVLFSLFYFFVVVIPLVFIAVFILFCSVSTKIFVESSELMKRTSSVLVMMPERAPSSSIWSLLILLKLSSKRFTCLASNTRHIRRINLW